MTDMAGCLARGRAVLQADVVTRLANAMSRPSRIGSRIVLPPQVELAYLTDAQRSGAASPAQLFHDDTGAAALLGHLDNRVELARALGMANPRQANVAHVALRLIQAEDTPGLARMLGDFALVTWDARRCRLVLCCDGIGLRPLYYRVTNTQVTWCSESRPLLLSDATLADLDEEYVADFLMNRAPSSSPYRGVHMLAGGEMLVVDDTSCAKRRFWSLGPGAELRYRSDAEYEEHFRTLFVDAVRCRMSDDTPVMCELSGGVDSSTIACVGDLLVREQGCAASSLHSVSYTYGSALSSDEEPFIDAVLPMLSGQNVKLHGGDFTYFAGGAAGVRMDHPTRQLMRLSLGDRVRELMQDFGATTLLSGIGGDQLFWSDPTPGQPVADHIAAGRWSAAARDAGAWSRQVRWPIWKTMWQGGILPYKRARFGPLFSERIGSWFDRRFAERMQLGQRMTLRNIERFDRPSQCFQVAKIRNTMRPWAMQRVTRQGSIDMRYPYLDRRLIEFAIAIPLEQEIRLGESRSIVRRGLRGMVPAPVLERRTKEGPGEAMLRALGHAQPWLASVLAEPLVAELGFVDAPAFRIEVQRAMMAMSGHEANLSSTIALELWLRELAGQGHMLGTPIRTVDAGQLSPFTPARGLASVG